MKRIVTKENKRAVGIALMVAGVLEFAFVRGIFSQPSEAMIPWKGLADWLSLFIFCFLTGYGFSLVRTKKPPAKTPTQTTKKLVGKRGGDGYTKQEKPRD